MIVGLLLTVIGFQLVIIVVVGHVLWRMNRYDREFDQIHQDFNDEGGRYCAVLERFDVQRRMLDRIDRRTEKATEDVGLLMRGIQKMGEPRE